MQIEQSAAALEAMNAAQTINRRCTSVKQRVSRHAHARPLAITHLHSRRIQSRAMRRDWKHDCRLLGSIIYPVLSVTLCAYLPNNPSLCEIQICPASTKNARRLVNQRCPPSARFYMATMGVEPINPGSRLLITRNCYQGTITIGHYYRSHVAQFVVTSNMAGITIGHKKDVS